MNPMPCPFCGAMPETFQPVIERDGTIAAQIRHPATKRCPLDMLVFRLYEWNTRETLEKSDEIETKSSP